MKKVLIALTIAVSMFASNAMAAVNVGLCPVPQIMQFSDMASITGLSRSSSLPIFVNLCAVTSYNFNYNGDVLYVATSSTTAGPARNGQEALLVIHLIRDDIRAFLSAMHPTTAPTE